MELWYGGLATIIKEIIAEKGIKDVKLRTYGYSDTFIEHGSTKELEKKYHLNVDHIVYDIKKRINK